jgi:hypothetical protein
MVSGGVGDDLLANSAPETPSKLQQRGSKSGETTNRHHTPAGTGGRFNARLRPLREWRTFKLRAAVYG